MSKRKPHNHHAGYVAERVCKIGGHVVIYDRNNGFACDTDDRWIVMHEPSSVHLSLHSLSLARHVMKLVAEGNPDVWDWWGVNDHYGISQ